MTPREVWLDINGWRLHQVSNWGRVRVLRGGKVKNRTVHKIELRKLTPTAEGYLSVGGGRLVHRLVLTAFLGPSNEQSRHLDGDGHHNFLTNLRWGSRVENEADKIGHGRSNRGERNGQAKLSKADVVAIRTATGPRGLITKLAVQYGVTHATVSMIRSGRRWDQQGAT